MNARPLILVVDDDAPILLLMRNLLREFGFEPLGASNGPEAIQQARTRTPDLILLDRNMPGMSGDEVLRAFRAESSLAEVPVLILSGEPIEPDELHRIGATGAVLKPFDVPTLVERIRAYVNAA
jgi:two-component system phosphate regulon response regulator PhoB